jgi:hypothetical protein
MSAYRTVDDYLFQGYGIGLEDVLRDGCVLGRPDIRVASIAKVVPRLMRAVKEDDGGEYVTYEGMLILDGLWYRFGCNIFIDESGASFLADISNFAAVEWKLRVAV